MAVAGKRIHTGVALTLTELCATDVRLGADAVRGWRVSLETPEGQSWPSLTAGLRELADRLGPEGTLVVALMPPLTEVRSLDLPPLKREQLLQLLSRNASRYFVTAREPQVVGATASKRAGEAIPSVLGVAAAARLVQAISTSARDAGWLLDGIIPAEVAWTNAAREIWPALSRGTSSLVVNHPDRTDVLRIVDGELAGVRRFRGGSLDAALVRSAIEETRSNGTAPRAATLGAAAERAELGRALSGSVSVSTPATQWSQTAGDPMLVAATWASTDDGLTLRTEELTESRAREGRRFVWRAVAASVVVLAMAAAIELWGARRELASLRDQRARIRPQLASTLAGRTNLETSTHRLSALFAAQRETPQLSGVLASVTDALPDGAYLLSFRARRDTLILDGLAKNSGEAFAGLENVPELANVRSIAGIQRQLQDDGTALEHFTVQARMLLPAAPVPPRRKGR
jgi:heme exporter protein D